MNDKIKFAFFVSKGNRTSTLLLKPKTAYKLKRWGFKVIWKNGGVPV